MKLFKDLVKILDPANYKKTGIPNKGFTLTPEMLSHQVNNGNKLVSLKTFLKHYCVTISRDINLFTTEYPEYLDYIKENRTIDQRHLAALRKSWQEAGYLFTIIPVNERLEIIDAQHRKMLIEEKRALVWFIILPGYTIEQVRALNMAAVNWSNEDFLASFSTGGNMNYTRMIEFMTSYEISLSIAYYLIYGNSLSLVDNKERFRKGKLILNDGMVARGEKCFSYLNRFSTAHPIGWMTNNFVAAVMNLHKSKKIDNERLVNKVQTNPPPNFHLQSGLKVSTYIELLLQSYNQGLSAGRRIYPNQISLKK